MLCGLGSFVLVGGRDLLDGNQLSVARAAIAHAGGVIFRRLSPTQGEGAMLVGRPRAVIIADDSLGFAVAEYDVVGGQSGIPPERSSISIRRTEPYGCGCGLF
jgi:hypothetical protein